MSSRIDPRIRQQIIEFPDRPQRGEIIRFCREHGISRTAFHNIRARAKKDGVESAIIPKRTTPKRPGKHTSDELEVTALEIRAQLTREGWDAGPLSVATQMRKQGLIPPSRATLARIFTRHGVVTPQPKKKPRAAYRRFRYSDPNGCWQLDGFEYKLDNGTTRCVLQVEDDHSRFILASLVAVSENSNAVLDVVAQAIKRHGVPKRFLTDNGLAFNQSRRGKTTRLEAWLTSMGVEPITGRPGHPTTQGKNERLHQTIQKFLDANRPIYTAKRLTKLVNDFEDYYNNQRANQALEQDQTPAQAYQAKPKVEPSPPAQPPEPIPPAANKHHKRRDPKLGRKIPGEKTISQTPGAARWAERRVSTGGKINISGIQIYVGRHLIGQTLHIMFDPKTIQVFDPAGTHLGTIPNTKDPNNPEHTLYTLRPRTFKNPKRSRSHET
jgi:transposase InsO family protein